MVKLHNTSGGGRVKSFADKLRDFIEFMAIFNAAAPVLVVLLFIDFSRWAGVLTWTLVLLSLVIYEITTALFSTILARSPP